MRFRLSGRLWPVRWTVGFHAVICGRYGFSILLWENPKGVAVLAAESAPHPAGKSRRKSDFSQPIILTASIAQAEVRNLYARRAGAFASPLRRLRGVFRTFLPRRVGAAAQACFPLVRGATLQIRRGAHSKVLKCACLDVGFSECPGLPGGAVFWALGPCCGQAYAR